MARLNIYAITVAHHDQDQLPEWMGPAKAAVVIASDPRAAICLCKHMTSEKDGDLLGVEKIGTAGRGMRARIVVKHEDDPRCSW